MRYGARSQSDGRASVDLGYLSPTVRRNSPAFSGRPLLQSTQRCNRGRGNSTSHKATQEGQPLSLLLFPPRIQSLPGYTNICPRFFLKPRPLLTGQRTRRVRQTQHRKRKKNGEIYPCDPGANATAGLYASLRATLFPGPIIGQPDA